ncbi:hypothetical protein PUR_18150 [Paenibacillus sp. URB8-2]|nr:hypothetical protein PUR_18150 [Paenibacillus sp. URB8-2]
MGTKTDGQHGKAATAGQGQSRAVLLTTDSYGARVSALCFLSDTGRFFSAIHILFI